VSRAVFCTVASILVKETENDGDSAAIEQSELVANTPPLRY